MHTMKRLIPLLALLIALLAVGVSYAQEQDEPAVKAMIAFVADTEDFASWLETYDEWYGSAWGPDENGIWYVEFHAEADDEWLGYANVDENTDEIVDSFIPRPLSAEDFQAQQPRVQALVLDDPEILALVGDPINWEIYTEFDRWEQHWGVYLSRGLEAYLIAVEFTDGDEGDFTIQGIHPANELDAEEELQNARDRAVALAWQADGVGEAVDGYDDWDAFIEHQGRTRWSVMFVAGDAELFYALVDIGADEVLESYAP